MKPGMMGQQQQQGQMAGQSNVVFARSEKNLVNVIFVLAFMYVDLVRLLHR